MHDFKSTKKTCVSHGFLHYHSYIVTNVTQTPGEKTFSLEVTLVKLDVRKCLDIVCEIQRAIFVRQLAMFLNSDKMMKLFKLRVHLFFKKKTLKWFRKKKEVRRVVFIYIRFEISLLLLFCNFCL